MNVGGKLFFLPQRPYMVLGTLRQQLLYPTWSEEEFDMSALSSALNNGMSTICLPVLCDGGSL